MPELRLDIPTEELTVLDAYCLATGRARADLVRELVKKFASEQWHIASVICKCAGCNPPGTESERRETPCSAK